MRARCSLIVCAVTLLTLLSRSTWAEDAYSVKPIEGVPDGFSKEVTEILSPKGVEVAGEEGTVLRLWFGKKLTAKKGFSPSFTVKYPFTNGQLVGVMQVVQKNDYLDFRGQEVKPGLYTLRYGLQPQDGNHLGTSIVRDFLLALPAKGDESAKTLADEQELNDRSSQAAQSTHPAIFALQGIKDSPDKPMLMHDEDKEFWILQTQAGVDKDGEASPMPIQMVVIGHAEG